MISSKELVNKLDFQPHPEGGYFKEVYRSEEEMKSEDLPERYKSPRCFGTSIYYMLEGERFSSFHKLKSDEIWHFYLGSPIILHLINKEGKYSKVIVGQNVDEDEHLQFTIPHGTWFAAEVKDKSSFSLVGCTVSPGFDFADFEMGERNNLIEMFPKFKDIIEKLTH